MGTNHLGSMPPLLPLNDIENLERPVRNVLTTYPNSQHLSPSPQPCLASTSLVNDQEERGKIPLDTPADRVATDKGTVEPEEDKDKRGEIPPDALADMVATDKGAVELEGDNQNKRREIPLQVQVCGQDKK